jgi:Cu(I)-responsive transcriptional regulator
MNIGEASEASGLPAKTIRYYEGINLLVAARQPNGYRDYSDEHIHKLRFLRRARGLGFSINDCRMLLSLYEDKGRSSSEVKRIAQNHMTDIEAKIAELVNLREILHHLVEHCAGDERPDCPIIDDLAGGKRLAAPETGKLEKH